MIRLRVIMLFVLFLGVMTLLFLFTQQDARAIEFLRAEPPNPDVFIEGQDYFSTITTADPSRDSVESLDPDHSLDFADASDVQSERSAGLNIQPPINVQSKRIETKGAREERGWDTYANLWGFESIPSGGGNEAIRVCSMDDRMRHRAEVCATRVPDLSPGKDRIETILIDNVHRAVWTLVPKSGTKSWRAYFTSSIGQKRGIGSHRDYYRPLGLNRTRRVSVSEINDRYQDYLKFLVTRHPLQKFVSAYFEVLVKRQKYLELCPTIRRLVSGRPGASCQDDPIISFTEFAVAVSRELLPVNEHWRCQQIQVKPCFVDLDLILKSETDEYETPKLSRMLGINVTEVPRTHQGTGNPDDDVTEKSELEVFRDDLTRYDVMLRALRDSHPTTFQWILGYTSVDMDMFGYTWDAATGTSGCGYASGGGCC